MDAYHEFDRLMTYLEDWYSDSTKAVALDAQSGSGNHEAGSRVLHVQKYPGPNWREQWARLDPEDQRGELLIIGALREEVYGLDHSPSQSGPASGLYPGTKEWKLAIAKADGSLRAVARRFGVSHTTVRKFRLEFGHGD